MPKATEEGKKPSKNGNTKKLKQKRILRLVLILFAIFLLISAVAGFATYQVVSAYMTDVPEFDIDKFVPPATSFIHDKDGIEVTPLKGEENRIVIPLEEMSETLIKAFIAIEDERFYEHTGFDIRGIMRAAFNNTFNRSGNMQGGSTITQQLVKNTFFTSERTMKRKVQELYLSHQIERIFTKDEILEHYLNKIFFAHRAYGVEAAAQTYFGKSAAEVTLAEAAILAGIPNLPNKFSPYLNMEEAKKRQALVLSRMVDLEMITQEEARQAREEELALVGLKQQDYPYTFFIDRSIEEAQKIVTGLPEYKDLPHNEIWDLIYGGGLRIYTTLDRELQDVVDETIHDESLYPASINGIRGKAAAIVVQPKTGHISAMSPGDDYETSENKINRVKEPKQAGSVFKPIIAYAPAFHEGIAAPGSVYDDAPTIFKISGAPDYYPRNYNPRFKGLLTVRQAIVESLNLPAIHVLNELGVDKAKEYAERMGVTTLRDPDTGEYYTENLAMAAGGLHKGISPYDTAQAFSVLANEGIRVNLTTITKIVDRGGKVIYEQVPNGEEIISREAAWLTTSALIDAVTKANGTGRNLRIGRPLAAKTGTSNLARDAWTAAYTPDYVAVVWIGRDSWPDPDKTQGNFRSMETVHKLMNPILKAAHEELPISQFVRPDAVRAVSICSKSGLRPSENCPPEHIITDYFLSGHIPRQTCDLHITVEICNVSGKLASEFCPPEHRETKFFFNRPEYLTTDARWKTLPSGLRPADAEEGAPEDICDQHTSRPDDVKELRASVNDDGTVTLSWPAASGASGYLLSRDDKLLTSKPVSDTSYTDKNLKPGTYSYQLQAINSEGVKSKVVSVSVTVPEPPPPEPEPDPEPDPEPEPKPGNGDKKDKPGNGNNKND
jgi:penicillin-binding protein 1A